MVFRSEKKTDLRQFYIFYFYFVTDNIQIIDTIMRARQYIKYSNYNDAGFWFSSITCCTIMTFKDSTEIFALFVWVGRPILRAYGEAVQYWH